MHRHWDAYCTLSIVHFLAFPERQGGDGPVLETVARIADDSFFSAIEISRMNDETIRKQAAQLIEQSPMVHAHVGNCVKVPGRPSYGDLHPCFGFPGGENDVPQLVEFLRALFKVGYLRANPPARPWIGFEVRPQAGEASSAILANIKRTWREAWARV